MALEDLLAKLIVSLEENTAALNASVESRNAAVEVAKTITTEAPAEKSKATTKANTKATAAPAEEKPPAPVVSEVYAGTRELIAQYLGGSDRPEERAARESKVKALLAHDKVRKPSISAEDAATKPDTLNIAEDSVALFKTQMNLLIEKGDLTQPESASLV